MSNDKKPDFSNVQGGSRGTGTSNRSTDFSNVQGGFRTTAEDTTPAAAQRSYTVESGDTLSGIAKAQYGKAKRWRAIFEANRDQIDDPDLIRPGQVLKIPAIDGDGDGDPD